MAKLVMANLMTRMVKPSNARIKKKEFFFLFVTFEWFLLN